MTPSEYVKKVGAMKFLDKKLKEIDEKGKTLVKVGCTGYCYEVRRGDLHHYDMRAKREAYAAEVNSYDLVQRILHPVERVPEPVANQAVVLQKPSKTKSEPTLEQLEKRRAYHREYQRKRYHEDSAWREKHNALTKAYHQRRKDAKLAAATIAPEA